MKKFVIKRADGQYYARDEYTRKSGEFYCPDLDDALTWDKEESNRQAYLLDGEEFVEVKLVECP